jgi:hypothetical protein
VSNASFEAESLHVLARTELLQGILSEESPEERTSLYRRFGAENDSWINNARNAYAAMRTVDGFVASVGDQLSCELDIRENAELYAAVGGFGISEITHGVGSWWSPSATWWQSGRALADNEGLRNPASEDFEAVSRLLLDAGAHSLATFFSAVAAGGLRLVTSTSRRSRRHRQFRFVAEVALRRGQLFQDGPDENGHYLRGEPVSVTDIIDAVKRPRRPSQTSTQARRRAAD